MGPSGLHLRQTPAEKTYLRTTSPPNRDICATLASGEATVEVHTLRRLFQNSSHGACDAASFNSSLILPTLVAETKVFLKRY